MAMTAPQEREYTSQEVAEMFELAKVTVKSYAVSGRIISNKKDREGYPLFTQQQVDDFAKTRANQRKPPGRPHVDPTSLFPSSTQQQHIEQKKDEAKILQNVLSTVFAFLGEHGFTIGIQSLTEVDATMRVWEIHTPDTTLRVLAENDQITVLSDAYQEQLEKQIGDLRQQVYTARMRLSAFEQNARRKH